MIVSCKPGTGTTSGADAVSAQDTLPQDFITFFDRFHRDSAYQMEHIIFPLEGLPNAQGDLDSIPTTRYFWQRADWKLHHPFTDPSQQFEQWFEMFNDRIIEHWVHMKGTNLYLHRRFAKLEDGWHLIYYAGMRPDSKKASE